MAEVSARSKTPVSRITDFFPNGDSPGATSRASSATSATGDDLESESRMTPVPDSTFETCQTKHLRERGDECEASESDEGYESGVTSSQESKCEAEGDVCFSACSTDVSGGDRDSKEQVLSEHSYHFCGDDSSVEYITISDDEDDMQDVCIVEDCSVEIQSEDSENCFSDSDSQAISFRQSGQNSSTNLSVSLLGRKSQVTSARVCAPPSVPGTTKVPYPVTLHAAAQPRPPFHNSQADPAGASSVPFPVSFGLGAAVQSPVAPPVSLIQQQSVTSSPQFVVPLSHGLSSTSQVFMPVSVAGRPDGPVYIPVPTLIHVRGQKSNQVFVPVNIPGQSSPVLVPVNINLQPSAHTVQHRQPHTKPCAESKKRQNENNQQKGRKQSTGSTQKRKKEIVTVSSAQRSTSKKCKKSGKHLADVENVPPQSHTEMLGGVAGPKKPRKRGARTKSAAEKSGKGPAVTTGADATTVSSTAAVPTKTKAVPSKTKAVPTKTKAVPSKGKPAAKASSKEPEHEDTPQKQITSFFPVRRSSRQGMTSREVKRAREKEMAEKIKTGCEDGLEVVEFEGKGRGVVATKSFEKDDFVVEYCGDLVNITTAKQREQLYERDEEVGCYMYYFNHKNKHYCIDATAESGKLGRLLNHSRKGNCHTKAVTVGDRPYLILVASQHIEKGEELTYDYGDRSQKALESHPWLKA